ncbi:aldo/keto reductase [Streptomyces sp. NPDC098789]|uniref:aldo/keto reductase n=1 Tax=Streptomyces sp. NPDC098789 TaxID=3366098 RepID=UPI00383047BD
MFISAKLSVVQQAEPERALESSPSRLQLDYVDLYLNHWPAPAHNHYVSAWQKLIELQKQEVIKTIGVCNFGLPHLERLRLETDVTPAVNQLELHPLLQQKELHAWNATHHIATASFWPLAQAGAGVFDQPVIKELAMKQGKAPAQVVLRWHLDHGRGALPEAATEAEVKEYYDVWDFRVDQAAREAVTQLDAGKRLGPDPAAYTY